MANHICPKCKSKTLSKETKGGYGIYEPHIRCAICGYLHILGAIPDSSKAQIDRARFETELFQRLGLSSREALSKAGGIFSP